MIGVGRGGYSAIGLDLGARRVKAVQLRGRSSSWEVHRAADFERPALDGGEAVGSPSGAGLIDAREMVVIGAALERMGFVGDRFSVAMSAGDTVQTILDLPATSDRERLVKLARVELARMCRAEPGELEASAWGIEERSVGGGSGGGGRVMAVACRRSEAEQAVASFARAGRELVSIDVSSSAVARGAMSVSRDPALVVDLGWESARIVALCGGEVAYQRALPELSMRDLHRSASDRLGLSGVALEESLRSVDGAGRAASGARAFVGEFAGRLGEQIRTSEHFASESLGVEVEGRLVLCGGGASLGGLVGVLESRYGFGGAVGGAVFGEAGVGGGGPALVQALGLAVRFDGEGGAS